LAVQVHQTQFQAQQLHMLVAAAEVIEIFQTQIYLHLVVLAVADEAEMDQEQVNQMVQDEMVLQTQAVVAEAVVDTDHTHLLQDLVLKVQVVQV